MCSLFFHYTRPKLLRYWAYYKPTQSGCLRVSAKLSPIYPLRKGHVSALRQIRGTVVVAKGNASCTSYARTLLQTPKCKSNADLQFTIRTTMSRAKLVPGATPGPKPRSGAWSSLRSLHFAVEAVWIGRLACSPVTSLGDISGVSLLPIGG
ncbi:hypothetical protein M747DRAFT_109808 [Aspergillus niger ATCC 13496]|uniref:Uncharacterized protein n=1 Tax=Aspergillus niger ATCC 13496 TaxID=1353008 RepID=A0A370BMB6_ASPNG|nr:hypothetical protein M747DRAFT_109808 [Aspergillus niger ATCC 13496]